MVDIKMTKQEYLYIKLVSNGDWFDWHDVPYQVEDFDRWREQGFAERGRDMQDLDWRIRVSGWRLTHKAHNFFGKD